MMALSSDTVAKLRVMLDEKGLTQAEVAESLGVTRAHVNQLLNADKSNMTLNTLETLAAAIGCRVYILVTD